MKALLTISLTDEWGCRQTIDTNADFRMSELRADTWERQPAVTEPVMGLASSCNNIVWLRKDFWLHPLNVCVRYHLAVEQPSSLADVYVNGYLAGSCTASSELDVTDFVTLDRNRLALKISTIANGLPVCRGVVLRAVPCEADR